MALRNLKTFLFVVKHGSFAAAAREIGLTQAAISMQMRALEDELKTTLFDRNRRSVILNSEGRNLVARARAIVDLYEEMTATRNGDEPGGVLSLGAIPPTFAKLLPDALLRFKRDCPHAEVRVINGVSSELTIKVERGELDAALVAEPPSRLAAGLSWHPIIKEQLILFTPRGTVVASLRQFLVSRPFIRINRLSWTGRLIDSTLRRYDLHVNDVMELDSLETIREMVARGFGVSVVPLHASRWADDARVTAWPLVQPVVYRTIGLVVRRSDRRGRLTAALRASLLEQPREKAIRASARVLALS